MTSHRYLYFLGLVLGVILTWTMTRHSRLLATTANMSTPTAAPASKVPEPATFSDGLPLPKLMVFDLDYTLWPFWVDTHISGPLKATKDGLVVKDRYGESCGFYSDVAGILTSVRSPVSFSPRRPRLTHCYRLERRVSRSAQLLEQALLSSHEKCSRS